MIEVAQAQDIGYLERAQKLLNLVPDHTFYIQLTSPSGRLLGVKSLPKVISLEDLQNPAFKMIGMVDSENIITFDIKTLLRDETGAITSRHHDFSAREFVNFALARFDSLTPRPTLFRGDWWTPGDNYLTFKKIFDETGDKVTAARSTWTGKTLGAYGFYIKSPSDVAHKNWGQIIAYFTRGS